MPIYEYECSDCRVRFERLQRFSDAPVGECPNGHRHVHRVLSVPAIIFNGPGFYVTDNRPGKKDQEAASSPNKGTNGKAESSA